MQFVAIRQGTNGSSCFSADGLRWAGGVRVEMIKEVGGLRNTNENGRILVNDLRRVEYLYFLTPMLII